MSHAEPDQLASLALDPDDAPPHVREHAATCPECAEHVAALADVRRLAGAGALEAAPDRVRAQVMAAVRSDDVADPIVLPTRRAAVPRRGRKVPSWAAGLAAAVALLAGLGLGRLTGPDPEPAPAPEASGSVVAATALTALDSDAGRGEASAVRTDDAVTLRVRARELGDENGFHEVWLINVDGTRMVALGVLADGNDGEFQIPRGLIDDGYRIVDISVEPEDGDPTHSGVSLARGELA